VNHFADYEVGTLMNALQDRMGASIAALVLIRDGHVTLAVPHDANREVALALLEQTDWTAVREATS
jgi:hypothetical protein